MKTIVVEHEFVTTLPAAEALRNAQAVLAGRGFQSEGAAAGFPLYGEFTQLQMSRGVKKAVRAKAIDQYPQRAHVEWDRGRVSVGLTLEPHKAKGPRREQCIRVLTVIAQAVEGAATGALSAPEALAQWELAEAPLVEEDRRRARRGRTVFAIVTFVLVALAVTLIILANLR